MSLSTEPAAISSVVAAILSALVIALHLDIDTGVQAAIVVVIVAAAGLITRAKVTPTAKSVDPPA